MTETAKELSERLYKELVGDRLKPLVIKYDLIKGDFEYHPYHHSFESQLEDNLINTLFDNIVFFAFENSEIENEHKAGRMDDLRKAAENAYRIVLPKTEKIDDGLLGELLLDSMLKTFYPQTQTIISRVKYVERLPKKTIKRELKGYDSLMFSDDNGKISLWLGQAKTGDWGYCASDIKKDLNKNIKRDYFAGNMIIFANYKRGDNVTRMKQVIDDINGIYFDKGADEDEAYQCVSKYFADNKIEIIMPALLLFPIDDYIDETKILDSIKGKCIKNLNKTEIVNVDLLSIKVMFLVFPVRDLDSLRQKLWDLRKATWHGGA